MESIPAAFADLFERKTVAHLATIMPDGTPQVTPVWIDRDDDGYVIVNTARNRQKERNVRQNEKVGVSIPDPEDPYRYLSIRGEVEDVTADGAVEHIDKLTRRYFEREEYPHHGEEVGERVILRIRPDRVVANGD
ncbi:PPOX class F420-dependent oxidoreductase [Natronosalvus rutilus]|uniref:PPOX class F420-dependent oxidoreductase n=1 Tax=Natronosalvus rutilus TaxID=2953753 RepID=A0A9E7N9L2_9EURY|nr:PPOX class F420-dependent oxidoreductase [Natronosalvus rutilus]UTF53326.1 PPOX class F420-dependent oxidoreductase [Natronosalvus rutilus]